jgi:hypothetical protein
MPIVNEDGTSLEIAPSKLNGGQNNDFERLPEAENEHHLSRYFDAVTNGHSRVMPRGPRRMHIYEKVEFTPHVVKSTAIEVEGRVPKVFFDMGFFHGPEVDVEELTLRGETIGYYDRANHVLVTTDWTHDMYCIEALRKVWPKVVEVLRLTPAAEVKAAKKEKPKVSIGTDPELEVVDDFDEVACAEEVLDNEHCSTNHGAQIGIDGAGQQLELRPDPSENAAEVVAHIRKIARDFRAHYPKFEWSTDGSGMPLGGHVHMGIGFRCDPPPCLRRLFDTLIGAPLQPLGGSGRGSYASMSNFESKDYGFEYRTPPAGYMADPEMTRIVFKACQGLMQTYLAGERFKVKKHPDAEDYKRICGLTDKEYAYFVDFIQNKYPKIDKKHVLKNWLSGKVRTTGSLRFEEGWDRNCAQRFREQLADKWMSKNGIHFDIVLFGLRQSRGRVTTISTVTPNGLPPLGKVDNDTARLDDEHTMYVGIPHVLRHNLGEAQAYAAAVMDAVKTAARKKEKEARAAKLPALMSLIDEPAHAFDAVPVGA